MSFDPSIIRKDFPILDQEINGRPLVYLDNAATTQTPQQVTGAIAHYYNAINSNIHRGTHKLARTATLAHEKARTTIAQHLNAKHDHEIIFTSGTTDSINLIANTFAISDQIKKGDHIIISSLEHHSNIVPWQMMCQRTGAELKVIPMFDDGTLDMSSYREMLNEPVKMVAVTHVSNALGTINPIKEIISQARQAGASTVIDGAQAIPHMEIDVQTLDCDFYVFSGHKIYGPTGIGILYGKEQILNALPPWRGGGEMIKDVSFEHTTYNDLPFKYEAGTPDIEGAISLAASLDYINSIGIDNISSHEAALERYAREQLQEIPNLIFYGTAPDKAAVISFLIKDIHHYDIGSLIDQMGIAVRTGHHCCQPLMKRFGITGTVRASFAAYNTIDDVDQLVTAVRKASSMLS